MELESKVQLLGELAGEVGSSLDSAQNDLLLVTDELAQLYHHVCAVNGETPSTVILDHEKHAKSGSYLFSVAPGGFCWKISQEKARNSAK